MARPLSNNIMSDFELEQKQIEISDMAEKFLDHAISSGYAFTEGLSNYAFNKAEQQKGML